MADTSKEYNQVIDTCRSLFQKKMKDYGSAWRILRLPSLTDQIFIKAQRIRGLQQNKEQRVDEGQVSEFIGIINYCIMALVQLEKGVVEQPDIVLEEALELYDQKIAATKQLMMDKNHDAEGQYTRTPITDKRQRNANCGNHSQRHPDIDKKMSEY